MQLKLKTVLNRVQHFTGFVFDKVQLCEERDKAWIQIDLRARSNSHGKCSQCLRPSPGYDRLPVRRWLFVPLWAIPTYFIYTPRRVECSEHGVIVEHMPWNEGKRPVAKAMMIFLSRWARRLSWAETARSFHTSWDMVYHSLEWFVQWGLEHRRLEDVTAIGIDEIHWGKGKRSENFLTVIYQIDAGCRRLLWVGVKRTQKTLRTGLASLGPEVLKGLRFVCSDMWKPYKNVIAQEVGHALHILDRFHIVMHLNKAVDQVRRGESTRLRDKPAASKLKKMRWTLLRNRRGVRGKARRRLDSLLKSKLQTARAWTLKDSFQQFWKYKSPIWAGAFMDYWCSRAMRSRLEPMKKVARMLRAHEELILNWFRAKGDYSSGAVEGLNNKIRVVTRKSYGFRTYKAMEIALYHNLGRLPEPYATHDFCG